MNIKSIVRKSTINVALSLSTLVFAGPASADTVTALVNQGYLFGSLVPVYFQLSSAPGVWTNFGDANTGGNKLADSVIEMAWAMGGNIQNTYSPNLSNGVPGWFLYSSDPSASGNYRITSIMAWTDKAKVISGGTMIVNFTTTRHPTKTSCTITSLEQASLVARQLFAHSPLQAWVRGTNVYDPMKNVFVWTDVCTLGTDADPY